MASDFEVHAMVILELYCQITWRNDPSRNKEVHCIGCKQLVSDFVTPVINYLI